jgi:hypothetical protein
MRRITEVEVVSLGIEAQMQSGTLIRQPGQRFFSRSRFPKGLSGRHGSTLAEILPR